MPELLIPNTQLLQTGVYVFRCPTCGHRFRFDDPYGPICTGPGTTQDTHEPVAMLLVGTVAPTQFAGVRGPSIIIKPFVYQERQTMTELIDRYFGPAPARLGDN
jgi:hypothetical protein